jgi:hypothetical protein
MITKKEINNIKEQIVLMLLSRADVLDLYVDKSNSDVIFD